VDFERPSAANCTTDTLLLRTVNGSLWTTASPTTASSQLDSCQQPHAFAPFTRLVSNATQLSVEYERAASSPLADKFSVYEDGFESNHSVDDDVSSLPLELSFMLVIRLAPATAADNTSTACVDNQLKCVTPMATACIERSLLCNCMSEQSETDGEMCDHLIRAYGSSRTVDSASCSDLLELNARCRRGESLPSSPTFLVDDLEGNERR
jgi:hypothetical protein